MTTIETATNGVRSMRTAMPREAPIIIGLRPTPSEIVPACGPAIALAIPPTKKIPAIAALVAPRFASSHVGKKVTYSELPRNMIGKITVAANTSERCNSPA